MYACMTLKKVTDVRDDFVGWPIEMLYETIAVSLFALLPMLMQLVASLSHSHAHNASLVLCSSTQILEQKRETAHSQTLFLKTVTQIDIKLNYI